MIKIAIFDLDGTLLNTVADIAAATNHALGIFGYPTHSVEKIGTFIGNGINKLFERALPEGHKTEEEVLAIRREFIPYYNAHGTEKTKRFDGMKELLDQISAAGIKIAVASNKYNQATLALVKHFYPDTDFCAILGQREGIPVKPDPTIVREICSIAGTAPDEVLYIGDSGVDMQTAINASVTAVGVTWGCRPRSELAKFSPAYIVDKPCEIRDIINNINNGR